MQASAEKIWEFAQQHLRSMLSADTFKLWFEALRAVTLDGNTLVLEVANDFCEVWLKDNYMGLLQDVLALASGRQLQVRFKVSASGTPTLGPAAMATVERSKAVEAAPERNVPNHELSFNPKNTFDTFV